MSHLTESQKRYLKLFSEYVDVDSGRILDDEFEADIGALRKRFAEFEDIGEEARFSLSDEWASFMLRYKFNKAMADFLRWFIEFNTVRPELINSGIYIVSEADNTAEGRITDPGMTYLIYQQERKAQELKLVIPAGVTQNQLKDFIQIHWKSFIAPKQELYRDNLDQAKRRVKGSNSKIKARVLELHNAGISHKEIATIVNDAFDKKYNYQNIDQIVYLIKTKQSESQR